MRNARPDAPPPGFWGDGEDLQPDEASRDPPRDRSREPRRCRAFGRRSCALHAGHDEETPAVAVGPHQRPTSTHHEEIFQILEQHTQQLEALRLAQSAQHAAAEERLEQVVLLLRGSSDAHGRGSSSADHGHDASGGRSAVQLSPQDIHARDLAAELDVAPAPGTSSPATAPLLAQKPASALLDPDTVGQLFARDDSGPPRALPASAASAQPAVLSDCPGSHGLQCFNTPEEGWSCSACEQQFPAGALFYGCRECDYD